ncbi:iron-sulfur cluster biosynthesis family protein [Paenibacillus macerans]|uniref:iron-sulfur cluster biosynthesis family protein n=1 Tax=Paenibacillus macerans TaxID=44252 RepID=UPI003D312199
MKVEITNLTKEKLQKSLGGEPGYFKLVGETEGCSAGSVYSLHLVREPLPTDVPVASDGFSFVVDRQQEILFDGVMRLYAHDNYPTFRLSSDSMLYSDHVVLKDKRYAETGGSVR